MYSGSSNILKNLMDDTDVITTAQLEVRGKHSQQAFLPSSLLPGSSVS
jgi:hypothetical protein